MKAAVAVLLAFCCAGLGYADTPPAAAPSSPTPTAAGQAASEGEGAQKLVPVAYFHNTGCSKCAKPAQLVREMQAQVPWVQVERFDFDHPDTLAVHALAMQALKIPPEQAPGPPLVIVDHEFLQGAQITREKLTALVGKYRKTGAPRIWDLDAQSRSQAEQIIQDRMQRYGLAGVMAVGLLDGINPCAFATLVFFVSYLAFLGRGRRDMLIGGLGFALGVFAAYLVIGLGATAIFRHAVAMTWMRKGLYAVMITIAFFFAVLSLLDYKKLREGRTGDVSLQLPVSLKRRIHSTIRERTRVSGLALGALVAGAIVSLIELGCTGQVYLPTIVGVLSMPALRAKAVLCLLLYNVAFIAPLLGVLAVTQAGVSSQRLAKAAERNAPVVKLLMFVLFALLAVYFAYTLSTLSPPEIIVGHGH